MNREAAEYTGQSVMRVIEWIETLPMKAQSHSEHVYRTTKLAMKLGFGAVLFLFHAAFPFLFTSGTRDIMDSIHKDYTEACFVQPVLKPPMEEKK